MEDVDKAVAKLTNLAAKRLKLHQDFSTQDILKFRVRSSLVFPSHIRLGSNVWIDNGSMDTLLAEVICRIGCGHVVAFPFAVTSTNSVFAPVRADRRLP